MLAALALLLPSPARSTGPTNEHVILLHGLCRTTASMRTMERTLTEAGYHVWNTGYASRTATISNLSESVLAPAIRSAQNAGATRIHFVGHSLGAILIRDHLARHKLSNVGRVVMLGPPNQGSEIVDRLGSWWLFQKINGPAGGELGTTGNSAPQRIGVPNAEIGVIAGRRSINWINSFILIPGSDDGKVSVKHTKLTGMTDHIVLPTAHPFLMRNKTAIKQTICFLREGKFAPPSPQ